jgi:hypothetical protein
MRRLERRRLVRSRASRQGRRASRLFVTTPAGRAAVRGWLEPPEDPRETMTADPLRTRFMYLGLLPPSRRRAWLDRAEEIVETQMQLIRAYAHGRGDDPFATLANDNALRLNRARLSWIRAARERLP